MAKKNKKKSKALAWSDFAGTDSPQDASTEGEQQQVSSEVSVDPQNPDSTTPEKRPTDEGYVSSIEPLSPAPSIAAVPPTVPSIAEEKDDDTMSMTSGMLQSPKPLERRLRGSLDTKPILDLSEVGETDLHEDPAIEWPEPIVEEPTIEDEPMKVASPTPSVKTSPAPSRSASPAPSIARSSAHSLVDDLENGIFEMGTEIEEPTEAVSAPTAAQDLTAEDETSTMTKTGELAEEPNTDESTEPVDTAKAVEGQAVAQDFEPEDTEVADDPSVSPPEENNDEPVEKADLVVVEECTGDDPMTSVQEPETVVESAITDGEVEQGNSLAMEEATETQSAAEEVTVKESNVSEETIAAEEEVRENDETAAEPLAEDEEEIDAVLEVPGEEELLIEEDPDLEEVLATEAESTPEIPDDTQQETIPESAEAVSTEEKIQAEAAIEDVVIESKSAEESDVEERDEPASEDLIPEEPTSETPAEDVPLVEITENTAAEEIAVPDEATVVEGDTLAAEANLETAVEEVLVEEAPVEKQLLEESPVVDVAVDDLSPEKVVTPGTTLHAASLDRTEAEEVPLDSAPEVELHTSGEESSRNTEPAPAVKKSNRSHRANLAAATALGAAAAIAAHEHKKHNGKKRDGHWERETVSPSTTTSKDSKYMERPKADARPFSSALAKQIEKAKEEREHRHESEEYKEKQRRRRQRRDARDAAEAEETRRERDTMRKEEEVRMAYEAGLRTKREELRREADDRTRKEYERRSKEEEGNRIPRMNSHKGSSVRGSSSRRSSNGSENGRPVLLKRMTTGESDTGGPLLRINMAKAGGYSAQEIPRSTPVSPPQELKSPVLHRTKTDNDSASGTDADGRRRHRHRRSHHSHRGTREESIETISRVDGDGKIVQHEKLIRRITSGGTEHVESPGKSLWNKVKMAINK